MLTEQILRQLWPHGDDKVAGLRAGIAASAPAVFAKYGLTTPLLVAHAMAQFSHECGAGNEMVENLNYRADALRSQWPSHFTEAQAQAMAHNPPAIANQAYNGRMGNRVGSNDGWNFHGRGLSQTTGREGYQKLGSKTGLDLINHPELVNDPAHALECAVADFILCKCLSPAQDDDVNEVTHRLNGGYIGLAERKAWLTKWKAALRDAKPITVQQQPTPAPNPKPAPAPTPAPKPAPAIPTEHKAAGAIVVGGAVAAQQAHAHGLSPGLAALVFAVFAGIGLVIWLLIRAHRSKE